MKKIILAFTVLGIATIAKAQFTFGPKAGINSSKETAFFSNPRNSRTRFYLGAFMNFKLSKSFSIGPEFIYSAEGSTYTYSGDSTGHTKTSYFLLPLLVRYTTHAGLYAETAIELRQKLNYYNIQGSLKVSNPYVRSTGFDWCFGIGYNADKIAKGLGINTRYITGLNGLEKKGLGNTYTYIRVIAIGLTYSIETKHKKEHH